MISIYSNWIKENVPKNPYGLCESTTKQMRDAFPATLVRVRGHYDCPFWGKREHWWCTDPFGNIIDPTKAQFPSNGFGDYIPWVEGAPEPKGKCVNCGAYVFDTNSWCSETCKIALLRAINSGEM